MATVSEDGGKVHPSTRSHGMRRRHAGRQIADDSRDGSSDISNP
jgi:hypothetical protein